MDEKSRHQLTARENEVAHAIVKCAYLVHRELGPGLYEHVYEVCFCHELAKSGLEWRRQVPYPLTYDDIVFEEAFRLDVLVDDLIVCEIKAAKDINSAHQAQLLTYLRFAGKRVGFVLNFNAPIMKDGLRRLVLP